jgi:hypothetical protein
MRPIRLLVCSAFVLAGTAGLDAQWLDLPTPGLPRLPDGKPDLTAPAPRTPDGRPDLSGLWNNDGGDRYNNNIAADLSTGDVAPWAHALFMKRQREFGKDSMETLCMPLGPVYMTTRYREFRIVQTPTLIVLLFNDGMHREIFMERYTRRDLGHMDLQLTLVDPTVFSKPITLTMPIALQADTEMLEAVCENHHASRERMAATQAAEVVQVPAATLSRYVGTYDTDDNGTKHVVGVTVEGADLLLEYDGKGKELLLALSPTQFSWAGAIVEFPPGDRPMSMTIYYVESTEQGTRRQ